MNRVAPVLIFLLLLGACGTEDEQPVATATSYNIDRSRITVSGASSGAMMAVQLHVGHSAIFSGVGSLAGGPYYCAEASLTKGLDKCMKGGDLRVTGLVDYARAAEAAGSIDSLDNLADDSVWLLLGSNDTVIHPDLPAATIDFYSEFVAADNIRYVKDVPVVHGIPTLDVGVPCDELGSPFINACGYDGAGELLQALYGVLKQRSATRTELISIAQPGAVDAAMLDEAYLYVPQSCADGESCGLHVAIHGCKQSSEFVGDAFATDAGYNEWAETNQLLVLYPQVASSKFAPMNPLGCWDWWGYTGDDYATKNGQQLKVIKATIDQIAGKTL